jgi:hypothetical protein
MNRVSCASGSEVEADVAVVRGMSPILSMVPEDRSRVGEVARYESCSPSRLEECTSCVFRFGSAKIQLRR